MSAELKVFTPADPTEAGTAERLRRLSNAVYTARDAAREHYGEQGVDGKPIAALFYASLRLAEGWEHQAKRYQRLLQAALATDALSDEQRAAIVKGLLGSTRRDAKLLTESEIEVLTNYRQMETEDRAVVRRYIARCVGASVEPKRRKGRV